MFKRLSFTLRKSGSNINLLLEPVKECETNESGRDKDVQAAQPGKISAQSNQGILSILFYSSPPMI